MKNMKWSFYQVWNKSLENRKDRPPSIRSNIWASEIGGAFIDRYLKMTGVKPTNPPNARALRKFEAGNMMEWIVDMVLKRAGVLIDVQEWVSYQYPDLLEVTGKIDQLAGGKPDWEKAKVEVEKLELPEFFGRATEAIIKHFADKYPDGLEKIILETKSCSSFMFDKYEANGADERHKMQAFHYLMAKDMKEAHIVYISKDDLRMLEFGVFRTPELEEIYKDDIRKMTNYIRTKKKPNKEKEIAYDQGKFYANWKVGYSNYLTKLYGYKNQGEFDSKYKKRVASWNRVIKRVKEKKNITQKNKIILKEIKEAGYKT
jgi:hypothetical protein